MILIDPPLWLLRGRKFSHLVSDESYEELHAFAARLGLPQRAFHRDHYDIPSELRVDALALGATEVSSRELVRRLLASGLRRRKSAELPHDV